MLIDKYTNTFFAIALLTVLFTVGWYSFNDYSNYITNQQELSQHSVDSTAREIEVLINNRNVSVKLFAHREKKLLNQLVLEPDNSTAQSLLETRVDSYFPNRLAVTVANEKGELLLKRGKNLVGKTCREDIKHFFTATKNTEIHVHPSSGTEKRHIDILSDTSSVIQNKTVFFVSFFLDDLFRILSHGQVVGHQLILVRTSSPELIETNEDETVFELEKLVGKLEKIISVKPSEFRNVWNEKLNKHILASSKIINTQWELRDVAKSGLIEEKRNTLILQAVGIIFIFVIMTLAGLRLTKRLATSRGNTNAVLLRIEEDRKRIAMDLHDQVLSDISHVQRQCRQFHTYDKNPTHNESTNTIEHELNNITQTIRHIIDDLHPHTLSLLGFTDAIHAYCNTQLERYKHIEIKLEIKDWHDTCLNNTEKLHLFRIFQESVDNVIKHAEANQCNMILQMKGKILKVVIKDNGIGIKYNKRLNTGHGIANIKERARILSAKVSWNTNKNNDGTSFVLEKVLNGKSSNKNVTHE